MRLSPRPNQQDPYGNQYRLPLSQRLNLSPRKVKVTNGFVGTYSISLPPAVQTASSPPPYGSSICPCGCGGTVWLPGGMLNRSPLTGTVPIGQTMIPEDSLPHDFGITPIRGYREWLVPLYKPSQSWPDSLYNYTDKIRLDPADAKLTSTRGHDWPIREPMVATCDTCPVVPSMNQCTNVGSGCGIYTWRHPADAMTNPIIAAITESSYLRLWGPVKQWGRIVRHKHGYRAQYAYPEALVVAPRDHSLSARLAEKYDVPLLGSLEECARRFPPEDPHHQPKGSSAF